MLGVYYLVCVITMEYLCTPELVRSGLFVSSGIVGGWTVTLMVSAGGSLGTCTGSLGVSWLMSRSMLVSGITGSSSASYVSWNL